MSIVVAVRASGITHFLLTGLSQGNVGSRRKGLKVTLRWEKERQANITSIHVNKLARIYVVNNMPITATHEKVTGSPAFFASSIAACTLR